MISCDETEALRHKVEALDKLLEHERQWKADLQEECEGYLEGMLWFQRERDEARALVRECYPWVKSCGGTYGGSNGALRLKLEALGWLRKDT